MLSASAFAAQTEAQEKPNANSKLIQSAESFDSHRILEVQIVMPAADWDSLRLQARDGLAEFSKERLERPLPKPYTWFKADVSLDGVAFKNVGVRKRGFYGSAHRERSSLNIDLERFQKGQTFAGRSQVKLHNNNQDATQMRQVLSYQVFGAAGVPAPRCSLAHVTVNGNDLGIYSQIEAIDTSFLKRTFGNSGGNLYEAAISDFRPGWTRTFEKKNNKTRPGREDLEAVTQALQSDDAHLLERLEKVLDVDAFINFWAVESLINHWDGFAGDQNNAFVYHDARSDRLRFIAWGADATFSDDNLFVPFQPPVSVLAVSYLPRRLYNHPVTREKYRRRLRELLATVWDEEKLLAEVDRLEKLAAHRVTIPAPVMQFRLEQLRGFIRGRRNAIEAELQQPAEPWMFPMRREAYFAPLGKVSATFSGVWTTNLFPPSPPAGKGRVELEFYGRKFSGEIVDAKASRDNDDAGGIALHLVGSFPQIEVPVIVALNLSTNSFRAGADVKFNGREDSVTLLCGNFLSPDFRLLAWLGKDGSVHFDEASRQDKAAVSGNLECVLPMLPWEDFDLAKVKKTPPKKP